MANKDQVNQQLQQEMSQSSTHTVEVHNSFSTFLYIRIVKTWMNVRYQMLFIHSNIAYRGEKPLKPILGKDWEKIYLFPQ